MLVLPGDSSPPKSGWRRRVPPLLMKAMKLAERGSIGAAEMSAFHQLSSGNTGSGPGGAEPWEGTMAGHCAATGEASAKSRAAATARWLERNAKPARVANETRAGSTTNISLLFGYANVIIYAADVLLSSPRAGRGDLAAGDLSPSGIHSSASSPSSGG